MKNLNSLVLIVLSCIHLVGCIDFENTYSSLPPGPWRGVLKLDPEMALYDQLARETSRRQQIIIDEVSEAELPFQFDVVYDSEETFHLEIHNGEEIIHVTDIYYGRDRATNKDTLRAYFDAYDSYLEAIFDSHVLEGHWVVPSRGDYRVHFVAHYGKDHRFTTLKKDPITDITGHWETYFATETEDPYPAIGVFNQDGNHLTATFRTETGDYRYLEGTIQADKLYLSCFDGAHMFLFEGKITDDKIFGLFRNGTHYLTSWEAMRNEDFRLADPDFLTRATSSELAFSFADEDGQMVDEQDFRGRPKLIQILGTWCPNCLDETKFLTDYLSQHDIGDLAVIGFAFERHKDPARAREVIARYRKRLQVPYPILHAGPSDKGEAHQKLPFIDQVMSYPTLLFVDRHDQIQHVHTGFNGPATSEYESFVQHFSEKIKDIIIP